MTTHRFNDIPINVDRLSDAELLSLQTYTLERAARVAGELALLDSYLQPTLELGIVIEFPQPELPYPPTAA